MMTSNDQPFSASTYADRLVADGVTIFLLHGVVDGVKTQVRNYNRKHIPKADFIALIHALKQRGNPVSMDDIVAAQQTSQSLPAFSFAITFDDGFENNLTVAAPVLVEQDVPGMFYITTDFVASNRMSWIDRIELAIEATPDGKLTLPWGEHRFADAASKRAFLEDVRCHVKTNPELQPDQVASDIQTQLGLGEIWSSDHPLDQKLSWNQVRELESMPGCAIGGHTHTHPIMSFLEVDELRKEISTCLSLLSEKAGLACRHFSYPEGLAHCFNQTVIEQLQSHGIVCSPTAMDGVNRDDFDLFHLRRVMVV